MNNRKSKKCPSLNRENWREFLNDCLKANSFSDLHVDNLRGSQSESDSNTILNSIQELSKSEEKKLLRKFGIIQSTSTSAKQQKHQEKIGANANKKRRNHFSRSKKTKRAKKLVTSKRSNKVMHLATPIHKKHSGTFTMETTSSDADTKSTLAVIPDSILDPDFDDYDANIEHDSIVTKYGLPYDIIQCACYLKEEIFGPDPNLQKGSKPLCISRSCCDFEKLYGRSNQAVKYCEGARKTVGYKEASETYKGLAKKARDIMDEEEFLSAVSFMKMYYPYYWKHVSRKEVMYLFEHDRTTEKFCKTQVILSCMRLLKEQDLLSKHYRVKMNGLEDGVEFNDRLNHNFSTACSFLKKEYPNLFVYLMRKYRFSELHCQKLEIIRNRLRLIKRTRMSSRQLKRLNEKYMRAYIY